jgi:hypothetical protein
MLLEADMPFPNPYIGIIAVLGLSIDFGNA